MNQVSIIGRLTADPELKHTQSGTACTRFSVAVDRRVKQGEEKQTDFINIVAWKQTAEFICKHFSKGQRIALTGSIRTGSYTDDLQLIMIPLKHNVSNCGYKIYLHGEKIFYATDCNNLDGIDAKDYDLYMIEANYEDSEIQERIAEKEANEQYCYEYQVLNNHLSKKKADEFIIANAGENSRFVYLHGHEGSNFNECF